MRRQRCVYLTIEYEDLPKINTETVDKIDELSLLYFMQIMPGDECLQIFNRMNYLT